MNTIKVVFYLNNKLLIMKDMPCIPRVGETINLPGYILYGKVIKVNYYEEDEPVFTKEGGRYKPWFVQVDLERVND